MKRVLLYSSAIMCQPEHKETIHPTPGPVAFDLNHRIANLKVEMQMFKLS